MKKLKQLILLCIFGCVPALWAGEAPTKEESAPPASDDLYVVRLTCISFDNRDWVIEEVGDSPNFYAVIHEGEKEWETKKVKALSVFFQENNAVCLPNLRNGRGAFTVTCLSEPWAWWWNDDKVVFTVRVMADDILAHKNSDLVYTVDKNGRVAIFSEDSDEDEVVGRVTFSVVAQSGAETQFRIGQAFFNGWVWEKNRFEAVKWFEKAAKQGHPRATAQMGACYRYGNGVEQNEKKAAEWFKKAATLGDNWGQFCYGACLCEGRGVEQNVQAGVGWVRKAIANGYNPKFAKEYLEKILEENK